MIKTTPLSFQSFVGLLDQHKVTQTQIVTSPSPQGYIPDAKVSTYIVENLEEYLATAVKQLYASNKKVVVVGDAVAAASPANTDNAYSILRKVTESDMNYDRYTHIFFGKAKIGAAFQFQETPLEHSQGYPLFQISVINSNEKGIKDNDILTHINGWSVRGLAHRNIEDALKKIPDKVPVFFTFRKNGDVHPANSRTLLLKRQYATTNQTPLISGDDAVRNANKSDENDDHDDDDDDDKEVTHTQAINQNVNMPPVTAPPVTAPPVTAPRVTAPPVPAPRVTAPVPAPPVTTMPKGCKDVPYIALYFQYGIDKNRDKYAHVCGLYKQTEDDCKYILEKSFLSKTSMFNPHLEFDGTNWHIYDNYGVGSYILMSLVNPEDNTWKLQKNNDEFGIDVFLPNEELHTRMIYKINEKKFSDLQEILKRKNIKKYFEHA